MENRALVFDPDMMFSSRIEGAGRKSGWTVEVATNMDQLLDALKASTPELLLVNLDALGGKSKSLPAGLEKRCRLVGYYSHVESELAREALANGFQLVVPRRAFVRQITELFAKGSSG